MVETVAAIQGAVKGRKPAQLNLAIYGSGPAPIFCVIADSCRFDMIGARWII